VQLEGIGRELMALRNGQEIQRRGFSSLFSWGYAANATLGHGDVNCLPGMDLRRNSHFSAFIFRYFPQKCKKLRLAIFLDDVSLLSINPSCVVCPNLCFSTLTINCDSQWCPTAVSAHTSISLRHGIHILNRKFSHNEFDE